jgi:hypothetical protein
VLDVNAGRFGILSNSGTGQSLVDVSAETGTIWSVGPVNLRNNAHVHGDVRTQSTLSTQPGVAIDGTTVQNQPVATKTVTISVVFPPSTDDRTVNSGTLALDPGAFRNVTVNGGAVTLKTGTYFFQNLIFNSGTQLVINAAGGAVFVYVQVGFTWRGTEQAAGGQLSSLRVVSFGNADVPLDTAFSGTVVAPAATIRLQAVASYAGAFLARSVVVQGGGITVQHAPFPAWEPAV